jgi:hypothetical protein
MFKTLSAILACAVLVGALALPAAAATEAPADMTLTMPEGGKATKAPVDFSHKAHGAIDCTACHHTWDGKSEVKSCAAAGCHDNLDPKDKKSDKSFYMAYHKPTSTQSCVGCHRAQKKAGNKTGPISCTQCHPKQ